MVRVSYISLCGFRGFKEPVRIEFALGFNVISGRNGVGKSTLCDAVEYVLTGTIYKYSGAKASGESVEDYIWWRGESKPVENFVEVGFVDDSGNSHVIKRKKGGTEPNELKKLKTLMCDEQIAPPSPLIQLSKASIIRDEFISSLSLDLKETERFQLLRDALGTPDSDAEIKRANDLKTLCTEKVRDINTRRELARASFKEATGKIEQLRARISEDSAISEATKHLQKYLSVNLPPDKLIPAARDAIGTKRALTETLEKFMLELTNQAENQKRLTGLTEKQKTIRDQIRDINNEIASTSQSYTDFIEKQHSAQPQKYVRMLSELLAIGQELGLHEEHCPLCNASHTPQSFASGVDMGRERLKKLNTQAEDMARRKAELEAKMRNLRNKKEKPQFDLSGLQEQIEALEKSLKRLTALRIQLRYEEDITQREVEERLNSEKDTLTKAENALRVLDTLSLNSLLESSLRERQEAEGKVKELEGLLAKARRAESGSKVLHDAARRAVNEALDDRLDLVGPLLGDLYRRLRPHTSWRDIDYRIRGDVKRFLSLEVGNGLNPQFIFSSGQRRATGLAFLLSIYLATSWSKFSTIILDDPVQHIDDFRAVHLAEVLASLHAEGHQVICAVEDIALSNLLCRRLPIFSESEGLHIKLGENERGALSVVDQHKVTSFNTPILQ